MKVYLRIHQLKVVRSPILWGLCCLLSFCSGVRSDMLVGSPPTCVYTPDSYGADGRNWQAAQGQNGLMYFANNRGLLRFDGSHWSLYPTDTPIRSINTEQDSVVWVGGDNEFGYFPVVGSDLGEYHSLVDEMPADLKRPGSIWQIFIGNQEVLFVAEEHLIHWDGQRIDVDFLHTDRRLTYQKLGGQNLVSQRGVGVLEPHDGSYITLISDDAMQGDAINFVSETRNGEWLIGTFRNGFFIYRNGVLDPLETSWNPILGRLIVYQSVRLPNGNIAIATHGQGILLMTEEGESVGQITEADGLESDVVFSLFNDRSGNLWACHETGISCILLSEKWTCFRTDSGFDVGIVFSLSRYRRSLYCGGSRGLFRFGELDEGVSVPEWIRVGASEASVWQTEVFSGGLFIARDTKVDWIYGDDLETILDYNQDILHIQPTGDGPGTYELSSYGKTIRTDWDDEHLRILSQSDFPGVMTSMVASTSGQTLWGSIDKGMLKSKAENRSKASPALDYEPILSPESHREFTWAYLVRVHDLIIAITNEGLFFTNGDDSEWRRIDGSPDSLGADAYEVNHCIENDKLWLTFSGGKANRYQLGQVFWDTESNRLRFVSVCSRGLSSLTTPHCLLVERESSIAWFGGDGGVIREELTGQKLSCPYEPIIYSPAYQGDEGVLSPVGGKLPYPLKQAAYSFVLPYYGSGTVTYRTRLQGYSNEWSQLSSTTFKEYTNLGEGDYRFEVQAFIDGEPVEGMASRTMTVLPPWWRTPLAYALFACGAVLLAYVFVGWRTHRLRVANIMLEKAVKERTIELEKTNIRLAQANTSKNRFLAHVSHEIRNPMNGIVGLAHLLIHDNSSERHLKLTHLLSSAQQLKGLLDGLLDFSAIENDRIKLKEDVFDLTTLMEEVETLQVPDAKAKGIDFLVVSAVHESKLLYGDAGKIKQIILNLTGNSIKFTDYGYVRVSVDVVEGIDDTVAISFTIEDTGCGIPVKDQRRIFEQFVQVHSGIASSRGLGLGLSISDRLAKLLGGDLVLESSNGEGSCFRLSLPVKKMNNQITDGMGSPEIPRTGLEEMVILVVEDEPYNQLVVRGVLEKAGATVYVCGTTEQALSCWGTRRWDLVLTDLHLPGADGFALASAIRGFDHQRLVPIVGMSAYVSEVDHRKLRTCGFSGFIEKPFVPSDLVEILKLGSHSLPNGLGQGKGSGQSALDYLSNGSPEKTKDLLLELHSVLKAKCRLLEQHFEKSDFEVIRDVLHDMTSSARLAPNQDIVTCIEELRDALQASSVDEMNVRMSALVASVDSLIEFSKAIR